MRVLSILLVLFAAKPVRADWSFRADDETRCASVVVGRCGAFGSGWQPPMVRLELGPVLHRTTIGPIVGTDEEGNETGRILTDHDVASRGFGGRMLAGYLGYYAVMDIAVSTLERGPVVHPIAGEVALTTAADPMRATGWLMATRLGLGKELRLGRLMVGGEVGVGVGLVSVGETSFAHVVAAQFLLDARARAGVWLTRHVSLSGFASASMIRDRERTLGLALGFSLFPWDGIR